MKKPKDDPRVMALERGLIFQITEARTKLGMSQNALSNSSGFEKNLVGRLERGEHSPNLSTLIKICDVLGLQVRIQ